MGGGMKHPKGSREGYFLNEIDQLSEENKKLKEQIRDGYGTPIHWKYLEEMSRRCKLELLISKAQGLLGGYGEAEKYGEAAKQGEGMIFEERSLDEYKMLVRSWEKRWRECADELDSLKEENECLRSQLHELKKLHAVLSGRLESTAKPRSRGRMEHLA